MANKDLVEHKSILAKLLAVENITVQIRPVPTASFNMKDRTLILPALKDDVSQEIFNLFTGHECSHALYTQYDQWEKGLDYLAKLIPDELAATEKGKKSIAHSTMNIVEDARIERLIQIKYPGLKSEFVEGYKQLVGRDFFGIRKMYRGKVSDMSFMDRLNIFFKCGSVVPVLFSDEEKPYVDEVAKTQTMGDVVKVCKHIIKFLTESPEPPREQDPGEDSGSESGEENSGSGDEKEADPNTEIPLIDPDSLQSKINPEEKEREPLDPKALEALTERYSEAQKQGLFDKAGVVWNVTIPRIDPASVIHHFEKVMEDLKFLMKGTSQYTTFQSRNRDMIQYLVKEFNLKKNAKKLQKAKVEKTGDLNQKRLWAYKISDDMFKKNTVVPAGKSHGLVLFLDWSGSMQGTKLEQSLEQLLCLTDFCRQVQIPFEVYAFSDQVGAALHRSYKNGELVLDGRMRLINFLSSKMSATDYKKMVDAMFSLVHSIVRGNEYNTPAGYLLGGTPLNTSIIAAMEIVPQFKKNHNLQIVHTIFVTDGDSNPTNRYAENDKTAQHFGNNKQGHLFLKDPVTGITIQASGDAISDNGWSSRWMTKLLIRQLRNRTQANVIGFFLTGDVLGKEEVEEVIEQYKIRVSDRERFIKDTIDNGYIVLTTEGYNEYYMISSKVLEIRDVDLFRSISVKFDSMASIADKFKEINQFRVKNRIMLSRFVSLIAE